MSGGPELSNGGAGPVPPFSEADLRRLFQSFAGHARLALAVSGGADSTALMLLVRRWLDLASPRPEITVLTVDHGLRPDSASEAEWVGRRAANLGFGHRTLIWEGDKPATGLQAAAREARYALMAGYCRDHGITAIATAHTSNDQAETLIMRLARGSGVDGLAGMAPISRREGVDVLRPLLAVPRGRLERFLDDSGETWLEDPSNRNGVYERVRIRRTLRAAQALGISSGMLTLSARRLGRARDALENATNAFLRENFVIGEAGFGQIALEALLGAPAEIALRALARMTLAFGGRGTAPQLSKIEACLAKFASRPCSLTLGGCHFGLRGGQTLVAREFGRLRPAELRLAPGQTALWDGRFRIRLDASAAAACTVAALGPEGARIIKAAKGNFGVTPHFAAITLPSLWCDGRLRFAPFVIFDTQGPDGWLSEASAEFVNAALLMHGAGGGYP